MLVGFGRYFAKKAWLTAPQAKGTSVYAGFGALDGTTTNTTAAITAATTAKTAMLTRGLVPRSRVSRRGLGAGDGEGSSPDAVAAWDAAAWAASEGSDVAGF